MMPMTRLVLDFFLFFCTCVGRFTEVELMTGENRWRAGEHGLQEARKGVRFVEFPPVLQVFEIPREWLGRLSRVYVCCAVFHVQDVG